MPSSDGGYYIESEKYVFSVNEDRFLGHIINARGIKADPDKIKAITELNAPTCVSQLRQFLGLSTY